MDELKLSADAEAFVERTAKAIVGTVDKMAEVLGRELTPEERGYAYAALTHSACLHIEQQLKQGENNGE